MNSVEIIGICKKKLDEKFRLIEYSLPCYNNENKDTQTIPVIYWTEHPKSRFQNIDEGNKVAIRGHLDVREKYGTILVAETFEILR